ncbi:hypothetical protein V3C99_009851 [Haemonchus contortus]|uniref:C6 domain-containing protein n=1 Tax=Haemonchus contortus TaxID=6289 RepID=A0A7I5EAA9_HAECO
MPPQYTILFLMWRVIPVVFGCAATSPGRNPTTLSPIRTTTTTLSPTQRTTTVRQTTTVRTTTAAPTAPPVVPLCQRCAATQVDFDTANGEPGRFDATFRLETNNPDTGCKRLTAICTAQEGFFSFMEFNVIEGGPAENQDNGRTVEALLECMDGAWFYRGIRQVNSVQCTEAPLP